MKKDFFVLRLIFSILIIVFMAFVLSKLSINPPFWKIVSLAVLWMLLVPWYCEGKPSEVASGCGYFFIIPSAFLLALFPDISLLYFLGLHALIMFIFTQDPKKPEGDA